MNLNEKLIHGLQETRFSYRLGHTNSKRNETELDGMEESTQDKVRFQKRNDGEN